MKYKKGQQVIVKSTKQLKTIEEFEIICDVEIYYMSDKSSYSAEQVEICTLTEEEKLFILFLDNQETIRSIIDSKSLAKDFARNYAEMFKKSS